MMFIWKTFKNIYDYAQNPLKQLETHFFCLAEIYLQKLAAPFVADILFARPEVLAAAEFHHRRCVSVLFQTCWPDCRVRIQLMPSLAFLCIAEHYIAKNILELEAESVQLFWAVLPLTIFFTCRLQLQGAVTALEWQPQTRWEKWCQRQKWWSGEWEENPVSNIWTKTCPTAGSIKTRLKKVQIVMWKGLLFRTSWLSVWT